LKTQVVIDRASEQILCVDVYNGKAHDGTIFKQTLRIAKNTPVLLDSGYRGVQKVHKESLIVMKHKEDLNKLSEEGRKKQKLENKAISSLRMKIEHVIGRVKRFNIISQRYRNRRKRFGLRINLICGIVNYENSRKLLVS
jgi:hypothetical protein